MGDSQYDLDEVRLDSKNENHTKVTATVIDDTEILILDTDSDSDVEIVSITPSQPINKPTPSRRSVSVSCVFHCELFFVISSFRMCKHDILFYTNTAFV